MALSRNTNNSSTNNIGMRIINSLTAGLAESDVAHFYFWQSADWNLSNKIERTRADENERGARQKVSL